MRERVIFSTLPSEYFSELLAHQISARIVGIERKTFGDPDEGERYLRLELADRRELCGKDVILVASTNNDEQFNELCRVGSAIAKYGAHRVVYAIPFLGYSTMERAVKPGEVVTAKVIARQLSQLPQGDVRNAFLLLDLHVSGLVHYFEGECYRDELYGQEELMQGFEELGLSNFMFASADLGRPRWVETFANHYGTDLALVRKKREFKKTKVEGVIGNVNGKNVVIYDDMTRSADSLIQSTDAYLERGALSVSAILSHLALNNPKVIDLLEYSKIQKIVALNSHPMSMEERVQRSKKFIIKDISPNYARAIEQLL